MLRPWGFAPVNAKSTPASRVDETYSWVEQPLYSTLPDSGDMVPVEGCVNLRMANRKGQRIIMINTGGGDGFLVCKDCGAAVPAAQEDMLKKVVGRPYWSKLRRCNHSDLINTNLGYDFCEFSFQVQGLGATP